MFRGRVRHVHFVGIGGIGMSGLAEILRTLEFDVSGSDLKAEREHAPARGARREALRRPRAPTTSTGADVVVYSSAIDPTNPGDRARARASRSPSSRAPRCSRS